MFAVTSLRQPSVRGRDGSVDVTRIARACRVHQTTKKRQKKAIPDGKEGDQRVTWLPENNRTGSCWNTSKTWGRRDVERARWSEAEDVWMAPPEAKAASSAFAFGDARGSEAVELTASS